MKKIYLVLMGVAALSFATLSCSKEAVDPSQQEQNQKEETVKDEPAKEDPSGETPVPEGMIRLTFGVSQEGDASANEGDDTKTTWDGTNHGWSEGDQIRIFWGTGVEDYKDATVKNNQVDVVVGDAEYYYAVYPATAANDFVFNGDGSIDVVIPKVQDGTFASANKMVAKTSKDAANLAFKNVTHIVKFHMTESSNYDKLEFTSNGAYKLIVDVFGVSFDGDNVVKVDAKTDFSTFGSGYTHSKYVQMNSLEGNKDYYFAVIPGSDFNTGFGVKAHIKGDLSGDDYNLGAINKAKITTDRNYITNIGNLDPWIHADWFIKEDGTGNGSSWEDAGNLSLFLKLIKDKTNDQGINSTWRLHNAKIHFAEGVYDIYAANEGTLSFNGSAWDMEADTKYQLTDLNLTIDGGYPSSNIGTSLDGKHPVNHPTKWQTAQTNDTYRVFEAAGCRMSGWTFDGITFEANGPHILAGDVFHFDGTTSGTVNFNNCYFKDFVGTSIDGGPIYVEGTGAVVLTFNGCTFSGNSCNTGGAAYFNNPNAIISITDCTFSGNSSANNGGAIRACAFDSLSISGGSFDSNKSTEAKSKGGAIYVDGGTTVTIDGTTFSNNIGGTWGVTSPSGRGGALLFGSSAAVTVKNATFSGNKASNGGAIHTEAGTVNIDNATFTENAATNGGAIRTDGSSHLTIDKCSFTLNKSAGGEGGALDIMTGTTDVTLKNSSISNCSAKKGGAICISQTTSTTYIPVSLYNTSIINNTATAGAGGIMSTGKNDLIMVNCTVSSNSGTNGGGIYVTRHNYDSKYITRLSMVSCTVTNNTASTGCGGIYKDTYGQVVDVYNCIISGNTGTNTNNDVRNEQLLYHVKNSVVADKAYISADRVNNDAPVGGFQWRKSELSDPSAFDVATMLSSLSTDVHSVINVSDNPAKTCGMSYEDLSSLSLSATPTQTVDTSFFTIDQKGNSREGKTTMGAYVGE